LQRLKIALTPPVPSVLDVKPGLSALVNLTELVVSDCGLLALPDVFDALPKLRVLEAAGNELTELPTTLRKCKKLEVVTIAKNKLASLSPLQKCAALTVLNADVNALGSGSDNEDGEIGVPDVAKAWPKLTALSMASNQLTEFPVGIGGLEWLVKLNLSENRIQGVPNEVGQLKEKRFQEILIDGNPLKDNRIMKILEKGNNPMKEFLAYIRKQKDSKKGGGGKKKGGKKKAVSESEDEDDEADD